MPPVPPARIGPYEVIELLGVGGMGEVYRAHDSRLRRDVALKILPQNFSNDPQLTGRLEREAQFLASLNHPRRVGRQSSASYGTRPRRYAGGARYARSFADR